MRLGDICKELPVVNKESGLDKAVALLVEKGVDALVVLDEGSPIGMLNSFDILERMAEGAELKRDSVKNVMNMSLLVLEAALDLKDAANVMLAHKHWMAVVTENGKYRGVVTAQNLLKALLF
jgi:CBS domain-containing protein